ncbi:MAG: diguanylate cyclase [Chloroflexi bacterium]|nr:diguanylate cyclase [Chloroflexota bacterium]
MNKTDLPLGDVYNIEVFQVLLKYEIERSRRYPNPLSMIKIEMAPTAFVQETLRAAPAIFSTALSSHLRSSDIPARSGSLYIILLPNSDKHGTHAVCERLLSVFRNKFEDTSGNPVTFSLQMGATSHPGGTNLAGNILLEKTAEALTQSQRKGPNTYAYID